MVEVVGAVGEDFWVVAYDGRLRGTRLEKLTQPPSYIVYQEGGVYKVKSGRTGKIVYEAADSGSEAIQYAINALADQGGTVLVKAGLYPVTGIIRMKSGVALVGEGFSTILRSERAESVISTGGTSGCTIANLRIEAPLNMAGNDYAIHDASSGERGLIHGVYIKAGQGIHLKGKYTTVSNCVLEGSGQEMVGTWAINASGEGNRIVGNEIFNWGHNAIMGAPNKGIIAYNYFHHFYDDCIDPNGNYEVAIVGNVCDKRGLDDVGWFVSLESGCRDFAIVGNIISGTNGGVEVSDSRNVIVKGNIFINPSVSTASFVSVRGDSRGVIVEGNYVAAQYLTKVSFSEKKYLSSKVIIRGNHLYGTLDPAYLAYMNNVDGVYVVGNVGCIYGWDNGPHIVEEGDSDRNLIEGNIGFSHQYPYRPLKLFISTVGPNTVVRGNLGFKTEASGTATIPAGSTYADVSHGLSITPKPERIRVVPLDNLGTRSFWVSDITSTTFRINISSADTVDHTFGWSYE